MKRWLFRVMYAVLCVTSLLAAATTYPNLILNLAHPLRAWPWPFYLVIAGFWAWEAVRAR